MPYTPNLNDLREIKAYLQIDPNSTSEDSKLLLLISVASNWIQELLNRPGLFYQQRTEIYCGTNTQKLLLRSRPIKSTDPMTVIVDSGANFGYTSGAYTSSQEVLTPGSQGGYCLWIDQPDGITSRSGILYRINCVWEKQYYRQGGREGLLTPFVGPDLGSIQITYYGGFSIDNMPSQLRFACFTLVAHLRALLPNMYPLSSQSWEDISMSVAGERKHYLLSIVQDMLLSHRNYFW